MKKPIGIKDIAERAKVSTGPVDKVINNRGGVSQATREKIMKAIEELGYKPNILASRLKSTKQYRIGILIPKDTPKIPFWSLHKEGFNSAMEELSPFGFHIEIFNFDQNDEISFKKQVDEILSDYVDSVFMVPIFKNETQRLVEYCNSKEIPVIFFDSYLPDLNYTSFIGQNSEESGYLAAELLNKCLIGNEKNLIVTLEQKDGNHLHFKKREAGFRLFYKNKNIKLLKYENSNQDINAINNDLTQLLTLDSSIKGIFVTNGLDIVMPIIEKLDKINYKTIGYDVIEKNAYYLKNGTLDYLISQQPKKQAYEGLKLFYEYFILKNTLKKDYFLPIDIVVKSNLKYFV
jgi:LacI family transcriptional regulator